MATSAAPAPLDVAVVGVGLGGLYALYRLRQIGLAARGYEAGSGIGGTWFWNRYPGARFDSSRIMTTSTPRPHLSTPRALARLLPIARPVLPRLIAGAGTALVCEEQRPCRIARLEPVSQSHWCPDCRHRQPLALLGRLDGDRLQPVRLLRTHHRPPGQQCCRGRRQAAVTERT